MRYCESSREQAYALLVKALCVPRRIKVDEPLVGARAAASARRRGRSDHRDDSSPRDRVNWYALSPSRNATRRRYCTDTLRAYSPWWLNLFITLTCIPPPRGAWTTLFAATSVDVAAEREKYKGAYIEPFGKIVRPARKEVHDRALATQLWEATDRVAGEVLAHSDRPGQGGQSDAPGLEIPLSSF
jgi:hypothetical protein